MNQGNEKEAPMIVDQSLINDYVAKYWHKIDNDRIQCDLCPRECKLKEGQRGFCFVRQNMSNRMILTTYGRSSGFCIDPIEKKPLNHFYPGSSILSFGTAGCNLGCKFCQNWDISKSKEMDRLADYALPEQIAEAAQQNDCFSVAFTYNDPVIFAEYAIDIAQACRDKGVKTVAVTAGYISAEARADFFRYMDAANVDLKAFSENFYEQLCYGKLQPVLDCLKYLKHETSVWFELTTLLIPGENDSDDELKRMTEWIAKELSVDVPIHFTAFHPDFKLMTHRSTPIETLRKARQIAKSNGLNYVYTGNVNDVEGGSTYCPKCNQLLIERDWYQLGKYNIKDSKCNACGHPISGHFHNRIKPWGRKRQIVRFT